MSKRAYDYMGRLVPVLARNSAAVRRKYRDTLRKLVREAVIKAHDVGSYGDRWIAQDAERIAKELVP